MVVWSLAHPERFDQGVTRREFSDLVGGAHDSGRLSE
jgi:hypothetical protein